MCCGTSLRLGHPNRSVAGSVLFVPGRTCAYGEARSKLRNLKISQFTRETVGPEFSVGVASFTIHRWMVNILDATPTGNSGPRIIKVGSINLICKTRLPNNMKMNLIPKDAM